ncbi:allatostatins-like [Limulus polyphemus]|uniref:Allatostatins-like n=1 Tax=Limulus polyphemus TaxID=6850 RepID=A0ABM1TD00_LIMPO|nr:allatostatins-like [Limulus polyphemus]
MFSRVSRAILVIWASLWMAQLTTISSFEERYNILEPGYTEKKEVQDIYQSDYLKAKRADQMYSFGFGKRDSLASPGKVLSDSPERLNTFLTYKRVPQHFALSLGKHFVPDTNNLDDKCSIIYVFGLGTRKGAVDRFSFGKRGEKQFNFGLGKRTSLKVGILQKYEDFIKRRFHFGLGKRMDREYSFGLG